MTAISHIESFDILVIGTGAVGCYALQLATNTEARVAALDVVEGDEAPRQMFDSTASRHRALLEGWNLSLGGTTQWWGGQLWPWQASEFNDKPGIGIEGWPREKSDRVLESYESVRSVLELKDGHQMIHSGVLRDRQNNGGMRLGLLRHSSWMSRRDRQFALNPSLRRGREKSVLRRGRVLRIEPAPGGCWDVHTKSGQRHQTIRARRVVLAAGTLGNYSILAGSSFAADLPNLGANFLDHVSGAVAEFAITDVRAFRRHCAPTYFRGVLSSPRLIPSVPSSVLPGYGHWEVGPPSWIDLPALKTFAADHTMRSLRAVAPGVSAHGGEVVKAATAALLARQRAVLESGRVRLRVDVQQPTDASNRLSRSLQNSFKVEWRPGSSELEACRAIGSAILADLDLGAIGLELTDILEPALQDILHPMGGTSMGNAGVVNNFGRLEVANGFLVAGASTFPSGGMANPTYTALASADVDLRRYLELKEPQC